MQQLADAGDDEGLDREYALYKRTRCGARTRRGTPCKPVALPSGRCPNHGGLSTGPRTPAGKRRALANLRQFRSLSPDELERRLAALEAESGVQ